MKRIGTVLVIMMMTLLSFSLVPVNATVPKDSAIEALKLQFPSDPISLTFRDADIRDVLRVFASELGLNLISDKEVEGAISFSFQDIHPIDAMNSVIVSQGYSWYENNGVIFVYKEPQLVAIKLQHASAEKVVTSLNGLLPEDGSVGVDKENNTVIIKAPQSAIPNLRKVVDQLDQRPLQALVMVTVLEVTAEDGFTLGGSLSSTTSSTTAQTKGTANTPEVGADGLFVQVIENSVTGLLETLSTRSGTEVLATPKMLALNHQTAKIETGEKLGFKVPTFSETGVQVGEEIKFLEVGTTLEFTPHISDHGTIIMELKPSVSEGAIKDGIPEETKTSTISSVMVRDGETIFIGGLVRERAFETIKGVPILMDVPVIDWLFKRKENTVQKKETVVLITPYIVTPEELEKIRKDNPAMQELQSTIKV